jgi:hypothetical protein
MVQRQVDLISGDPAYQTATQGQIVIAALDVQDGPDLATLVITSVSDPLALTAMPDVSGDFAFGQETLNTWEVNKTTDPLALPPMGDLSGAQAQGQSTFLTPEWGKQADPLALTQMPDLSGAPSQSRPVSDEPSEMPSEDVVTFTLFRK